YFDEGGGGEVPVGGQLARHACVPRRGVGGAVARRPPSLRDAHPRGRSGRVVLGHHPQPPRRIPARICVVRPRHGGEVRCPPARTAPRRRGHHPPPPQD